MELPWPGTGSSPLTNTLAIGTVLKNAGVSLTIGDEQAAVWPESDIRRSVKGVT